VFDQVLVCIDGSSSSQRAIDLGLDIARVQGARLAGLAIVDEPDIRDQALVADATHKAHAWLEAFAQRCRATGIEPRLMEAWARPSAAILEHMPAFSVTLIGQDANSLFETAMEDTKTRDQVLHVARKPVMVVPDAPPVVSQTAMIAFDGSAACERAVRALAASGLVADATVHVVAVDDDGARAWQIAGRGAALCEQLGIKATPVNVVSTLPIAEALLEARARVGARLLAMGAYTRSRLTEVLWGSVTRVLTQRTPVPLFLHH
jgi:nucleotide-binding universal stress UspA family protein